MSHAQANLAQLRQAAQELGLRCPECYGAVKPRRRGRWECPGCYETYELDDLVELEGSS